MRIKRTCATITAIVGIGAFAPAMAESDISIGGVKVPTEPPSTSLSVSSDASASSGATLSESGNGNWTSGSYDLSEASKERH